MPASNPVHYYRVATDGRIRHECLDHDEALRYAQKLYDDSKRSSSTKTGTIPTITRLKVK